MNRWAKHVGPCALPGQIGPGLEDFTFEAGGQRFSVDVDFSPDVLSAASWVPPAAGLADRYMATMQSLRTRGAQTTQAVLDTVAAIAVMCPPPYGQAVALGAGALSFAAGLFSGDTDAQPPAPNIAGINLETLTSTPLSDPDHAVIAGKIASGGIQGTGGAGNAVIGAASATFSTALRKFIDLGATPSAMPRVNAILTRNRSSWRAVCYFAAHAPYDRLGDLANDSRPATLQHIGKMLAWAAPRLQFREMLFAWCAYRRAQAMYVATGGNPNGTIRQSGTRNNRAVREGQVRPLPGSGSVLWSSLNDEGYWSNGWSSTRKLASVGGGGVAAWIGRILLRAMPIPTIAGDPPLLVYAPIPADVIRSEMDTYYMLGWPARRRIMDIAVSGAPAYQFWLPWRRADHEVFVDLPETWAQATVYCYRMTEATQVAVPDFVAEWAQRVSNHRSAVSTGERNARDYAASETEEFRPLLATPLVRQMAPAPASAVAPIGLALLAALLAAR